MTTYDDVPYSCQPIPCTSPEQLAVVSLFHGGPCPSIESARVLEVGCGDGANLLPLAYHRRHSQFVGIDASRVQIDDALRATTQLGLDNVRFDAADVRTVAVGLDRFDFIIIHGVLSWVADEVRTDLLSLCRDHLADDGLLYVSYNTQPGWSPRGLVRDIVRRAGDAADSLARRAGKSRELGAFIREQIQRFDHPYADLLSLELGRVVDAEDPYLIHEYLAEHNQAFWLRDFADMAADRGLRYVADASFNQPNHRTPDALQQAARNRETDPLRAEELIDVLWYRQHRTSILCREEAAQRAPLGASILDRVTIASGLLPTTPSVVLDPGEDESFRGYFEPDVEVAVSDSLTKAAMSQLLTHWPRGLDWNSLLEKSSRLVNEARLPKPSPDDIADLATRITQLYEHGQVELRLCEPVSRLEVDVHPSAAGIARFEADRRPVLTSPGHQRLGLRPDERWIVSRLDGQASPAEIAAQLAHESDAGRIPAAPDRSTARAESRADSAAQASARDHVDRTVGILAMWGLLEMP